MVGLLTGVEVQIVVAVVERGRDINSRHSSNDDSIKVFVHLLCALFFFNIATLTNRPKIYTFQSLHNYWAVHNCWAVHKFQMMIQISNN